MKLVTQFTIENSKKIRKEFALLAIKRDGNSIDGDTALKAQSAQESFSSLSKEELISWAMKEHQSRQDNEA